MGTFGVNIRQATVALGLCALAPQPAAAAQPEAVVVTDHARTTLMAAPGGVAPGGTTTLVLRQELQDGWHVYWRNPGDSGLPLELDWRLPAGFTVGPAAYPAPERIPAGPFVNFGHKGAPAFLIEATAPADAEPGTTVDIGLTATWLICEDVCVPETGVFALTLPVVADPPPAPRAEAYAQAARAAQPKPFPGNAAYVPTADGFELILRPDPDALGLDPGAGAAFFFPETEGLSEPAGDQPSRRTGDALTLAVPGGLEWAPDRDAPVAGVLRIGEGRRAAAWRLVAARADDDAAAAASSSAAAQAPPARGGAGLAGLFLFAFLGGALLNLMPCVFPVIFLKAAGWMRAAGGAPAEARRHGLVYAAGAVATFAGLGGLLLALRAGGAAIGWGFHLQSPIVVAASAYVLFAVGLNLAGVFTVGRSLQGLGDGLTQRGGDVGAFFTGALAVAVAAPCIGPLLGAPMGAALILPPAAGLAIFVAMGLGLAAPYVALSSAPKLAARLPRPGPWMDVVRQALAFPVFGAAAFFVWVLAEQTGPSGLAAAFAGLIALALALWAFERGKDAGRRPGAAWRAVSVAALVLCVLPVARLSTPPPATAGAPGGYGRLAAEPWSEARIAEARAQGRGVFVDFTAAWCVVCQVNKATILSRPSVAEAFAAADVALLAADWTRRDAEVTAALERFGATGVPLYVYYPPVGPAEILPLPLTERAIREALAAPRQAETGPTPSTTADARGGRP